MRKTKYNKEIAKFFLESTVAEYLSKKKQYENEPLYLFLTYRIEGGTIQDSCALTPIAEDTIYKWKNRYVEFSEADKKAEMYFKRFHIQKVSGNKTWQSSAWLLERRYQNEYSIKQRLDVTSGNEPLNYTVKIINGNTSNNSSSENTGSGEEL